MPRKFTNEQLAECAEREVRQRKHAYARRVADGRMSADFARQQTEMMEEIAGLLRVAAKRDAEKGDLFGGQS